MIALVLALLAWAAILSAASGHIAWALWAVLVGVVIVRETSDE